MYLLFLWNSGNFPPKSSKAFHFCSKKSTEGVSWKNRIWPRNRFLTDFDQNLQFLRKRPVSNVRIALIDPQSTGCKPYTHIAKTRKTRSNQAFWPLLHVLCLSLDWRILDTANRLLKTQKSPDNVESSGLTRITVSASGVPCFCFDAWTQAAKQKGLQPLSCNPSYVRFLGYRETLFCGELLDRFNGYEKPVFFYPVCQVHVGKRPSFYGYRRRFLFTLVCKIALY